MPRTSRKYSATIPAKHGVRGEAFSAAQLKPALRAALEASSNGLSENLLLALIAKERMLPLPGHLAANSVSHHSSTRAKLRSSLTSIGAHRDPDEFYRWRL